jgi:hypothetical protein
MLLRQSSRSGVLLCADQRRFQQTLLVFEGSAYAREPIVFGPIASDLGGLQANRLGG